MERSIILVAETGSDTPASVAEELGIILVPMHVNMGDQTLDDGTFPPADICAYYDRTALNTEAALLGYQKISWIPTGCVITCHGGAGAFGIVGTVQ